MTVVFALEALYGLVKTAVEASFATVSEVDDVPVVTHNVTVDWGQTRPQAQINRGPVGRVVFVPGSPDGDMGELAGAKHWPQPARPLYCLPMPFQIYVWGHDPAAQKSNDPKHDHAAFRILHEVIRQIRTITLDGHNTVSPVTLKNPRILKPTAQHVLGREYLLLGVIEQPILDMLDDTPLATDVAPVDGEITDTLGNRSEVSYVEPD